MQAATRPRTTPHTNPTGVAAVASRLLPVARRQSPRQLRSVQWATAS